MKTKKKRLTSSVSILMAASILTTLAQPAVVARANEEVGKPQVKANNSTHATSDSASVSTTYGKDRKVADKSIAKIANAKSLPSDTPITPTTPHVSDFSVDEKYLAEYNKVFKIPNTNISSITNNGGNYQGSLLKNAIDGDIKTHWETGKPNNATFKNEIIFSFDKEITLDRIVYYGRKNGATNKGYPKAFKIYSSKKNAENTFELVADGKSTVSSKGRQIQFAPITCKQIKFVFEEAQDNWAAAGEFTFYKQDEFKDIIDDVFTDATQTKLNDAYNSKEALAKLETLWNAHPEKEVYASSMENAKRLLENPNLSEELQKEIYTLEQNGSATYDAWTIKKQPYQLSDYLPSGLYYSPGETFELNVDVAQGDPMPAIVFDGSKTVNLKRGLNIVTVPDNVKPNAVYFKNLATPDQQQYAPRISIKKGGNPYPLFVSGSDENEFRTFLKEYKANMDEQNVDGKTVVPNIAGFVTRHVISAAHATQAYNLYIKDNFSPQQGADSWEDMLLFDYKLLGYSEDAAKPIHKTPTTRILARVDDQGGMWAGGGQIGVGSGSVALGSENLGWGVYHEVGHVIEMNYLKFGEMTNNIFSMANQERVGEAIRVETDDILNNITSLYTSGKIMGNTYGSRPDAQVKTTQWSTHLLLWQLRIAFGMDFYTDVFTAGRDDDWKGGKGASNNWAYYGSKVTGYDLGAYLYRIGFDVSEETRTHTAQYKAVDMAIQYGDKNARTYKGTGFEAGYKSKIASIDRTDKGVVISIDAKDCKDDVLGFEIYRDGTLIGYTNKTSYTDNSYGDANISEYKIVAYDRKLKPAKASDSVKVNLVEPFLYVNKVVKLGVGDLFNPLDGIVAKDVTGTDITGNIKVKSSNVDTNKAGEYEVIYEVVDAKGNAKEAATKVIVFQELVTKAEFASDLTWSLSQGSYKPNRNDISIAERKITLFDGNKNVGYDKGLGVHAKSTIAYDISDKNYDTFQAYVGVDRLGGRNNVSSVVFEVYVDGIKKFDSGIMKYGTTSKKVSVNVFGAKEIKLIMTDAGNGNGSDHGDWADAKFITAMEADDLEVSVLHATLQDMQRFMEPITDISYVAPNIDHKEIYLNNILEAKPQVEKILSDPNVTKETLHLWISHVNFLFKTIGQTYVEGGQPIRFIDYRAELMGMLAFLKPITNISYVAPHINNKEIYLSNVIEATAQLEELLADKNTSEETLRLWVSHINFLLKTIGQTYVEGGQPIVFDKL